MFVSYIAGHSESRGLKSSNTVIVQNIYLGINMRDGYTLEH